MRLEFGPRADQVSALAAAVGEAFVWGGVWLGPPTLRPVVAGVGAHPERGVDGAGTGREGEPVK